MGSLPALPPCLAGQLQLINLVIRFSPALVHAGPGLRRRRALSHSHISPLVCTQGWAAAAPRNAAAARLHAQPMINLLSVPRGVAPFPAKVSRRCLQGGWASRAQIQWDVAPFSGRTLTQGEGPRGAVTAMHHDARTPWETRSELDFGFFAGLGVSCWGRSCRQGGLPEEVKPWPRQSRRSGRTVSWRGSQRWGAPGGPCVPACRLRSSAWSRLTCASQHPWTCMHSVRHQNTANLKSVFWASVLVTAIVIASICNQDSRRCLP